MAAIKWIDKSIHTPGRTVLTEQDLTIPGLKTFGNHHEKRAYQALPDHYHPNCLEITYLDRGSATYNIENQVYTLYPGDLFITQPDAIHSTNEIPLSMNSMYWFQLDISDPDGFLFLHRDMGLKTITQLRNFGNCSLSLNQAFYTRIFGEIFRCFNSSDRQQQETGCSILLYFLKQLVANSSAHGESIKQTSNILRVFYFIKNNIKEDFTMDQLAELAHLSTSRFKQKFTLEIGLSPRTFINSEKITASTEYLLEGHNVTETASEFNFSSSNYYCEVFKRFQGKSPTQFLKEKRDEKKINYIDGFNQMFF